MRSPLRMPQSSPARTGRPPVVTERHALELHELLRGNGHRREREFERAVDVRRRDPLHSLERLDPALRLLRLRGLGAEAVDERRQMRDLPLLLRVGRLLQRELQRALALELRVVPGVGPELLRVEVDDAGDDAVEEIAVVGDEQQRAGIAGEPVLEPQHGVEVEVVGRLVEEQEVRPAHQRLREIQAHAPAAGKARDGVAVGRGREPEAGEERRGAGARRIAADILEAVMQQREQLRPGVRDRWRRPPRRPPALARSRAARGRRPARTRSRGSRRRAFPARRARSSRTTAARRCRHPGAPRPRISAKRLDLPQPFGPTRPTLCPGWTVRFAPSSRRLTPRARTRSVRRSIEALKSGRDRAHGLRSHLSSQA